MVNNMGLDRFDRLFNSFLGSMFLLYAVAYLFIGPQIMAIGSFVYATGCLLPFEWDAHPERYPDCFGDDPQKYALILMFVGIVLMLGLGAIAFL